MTSFSRRDLVKGGAAMAGGLVLRARPVRAATKVRLLTNWFAEAEHGGFYQAVAAGLYDKAGLDVEIRQGNAQLNGMQVLLGGEADIIMSYDITILNGVEKGAPVKAFFTSFQFDLIGLMTRPEINSLAELKGRKVYFGANGYSSYWPWLKQRFGFTDEMAAPKGPNLATFFNDPPRRWQVISPPNPFSRCSETCRSNSSCSRNKAIRPMPTPWSRPPLT